MYYHMCYMLYYMLCALCEGNWHSHVYTRISDLLQLYVCAGVSNTTSTRVGELALSDPLGTICLKQERVALSWPQASTSHFSVPSLPKVLVQATEALA